MTKRPETYLRAALVDEGLEVRSLEIEAYAPEHFGDFIAKADTDRGKLHIVYDRGFFVDALPDWTGPSTDRLVAAMEYRRFGRRP